MNNVGPFVVSAKIGGFLAMHFSLLFYYFFIASTCTFITSNNMECLTNIYIHLVLYD